MNKYVRYIIFCSLILLSFHANSQDTTSVVKNSGKLIEFLSAESYNIKKIDYSSTSAYYGLKNTPPLSEDMERDCLNPYTLTKIAGEDLCVLYNNFYELPTISLRYFLDTFCS